MRRIRKHLHWAIPAMGLIAVFALVAWKGTPRQRTAGKPPTADTIPAQSKKAVREGNERDLDKEIRKLEEAKEKMKDVNWDQVKESIEQACKSINTEQIEQQIEQAMKQVDMEKINREVQESLKKIDFDKINKEVNESLKEAYASIDKEALKKQMEEVRLEVQRELSNKNWKKEIEEAQKLNKKELQKELERSREDIKKAMRELDEEKLNLRESLDEAWKGIDKAKEEFKGYQEMIYSMEKEGLLSTKSDYTIKYKDGNLTVNGKKQPQEVLDRYKKYFSHEKVTIRKEDGDMDIDFD
jgi:chromosome segregation ATPase